jgi:hypothetical protein
VSVHDVESDVTCGTKSLRKLIPAEIEDLTYNILIWRVTSDKTHSSTPAPLESKSPTEMSADEYPRGCEGGYIRGWSSNDRFQYPTTTASLRSYYYLPAARMASLERINRACPGPPPPSYDERDEYHRKILLAATKILKSGKARRRRSFALDENENKEWYTIKCTCGKSNDDGDVVYCMDCDTWQHMKCYYPDRVSSPALGVIFPRGTF